MALSPKAMLIGGGAAGALLLLLRRGDAPRPAPLPGAALARPPAAPGTPQVQQVAGDIGAVISVAQQAKSFFDSLPSWGASDGPPALGADASDPSVTFT